MKIRNLILLLCITLCYTASAQALWDVMPPLPDAISQEPQLSPAALQARVEREKEKYTKFVSLTQQNASINQTLLQDIDTYIRQDDNQLVILAPQASYTLQAPYMEITNSSLCHQHVEWNRKKPAVFNEKKDYLQNVYLSSNNEITVINHRLKNCDMNDFTFSYDNTYFHIEGTRIILDRTATDVLTGACPSEFDITIQHPKSGLQYKYKIQLSFQSSTSCAGCHKHLAIAEVQNVLDERMAAVCDLDEHTIEYFLLPFFINAHGRWGSDGRDGSNGLNGMNELDYTDKNGKEHHINGTCAEAGQDGGNGEDGGDGGQLFICLSPQLVATNGLLDIDVNVDAGRAGKAGKGGQGGIHGKGSSCYGKTKDNKAPDGKDGIDGKDGKPGDYLYLEANTNQLFQQLIPNFPTKL